jgi:hypothetical protein
MYLMRKQNIFLVFVFLIVLVTPSVNADLITPGYRPIKLDNIITNIENFPDYVFVSAPVKSFGPGLGMCPVHKIEKEGVIEGYYKFCSISVYAIPKEKFNQTLIEGINKNVWNNYTLAEEKFFDYISDSEIKEVIRDITIYQTVLGSSPTKSITYYYNIEIDKTKLQPDKEVTEKNSLIYFYIIVPLIALLLIFLVIKKRK